VNPFTMQRHLSVPRRSAAPLRLGFVPRRSARSEIKPRYPPIVHVRRDWLTHHRPPTPTRGRAAKRPALLDIPADGMRTGSSRRRRRRRPVSRVPAK
jgi:hypothetical protein